MNAEERATKDAERKAKKRAEALARQARLQAAELARAKRYVLCVNGDPNLPITVDSIAFDDNSGFIDAPIKPQ